MENPQIHPAATVAVIREIADSNMEVLLLKRNSTLAFGPDHWVFPGGRIDEQDFQRVKDLQEAAKVAAVRECAEETGLKIAVRDLTTLSHWTTPSISPKRFATYFFVTHYCGDKRVEVDGIEIIDHLWLTPEQALEQLAQQKLKMMLPTIHTLKEMFAHASVADYLEMCASRPMSKIMG